MEMQSSTASREGTSIALFVEDTYGVDFYRVILDRLRDNGLLPSRVKVRVVRLPSRRCNPGLESKIVARLGGRHYDKVVIVVDSDFNPEDAKRNVARHLRKLCGIVKLVVVDPRHEAWLCLGLGGSPSQCRSRPEDYISRRIGRLYEKRMLGELAREIDVNKLAAIDPGFASLIRLLTCNHGVSTSVC